MSGSYSLPQRNPRTKKLSAFFALAAHLTVLLLGGVAFSQPAQFGVEAGLGGMEVHLIAAPAFIEAPEAVQPPAPDTVVIDKAESTEKEPAPLPKQEAPEVRGDGSSPVPGKDHTTLHTAAGAETEAKPNYLKNPAPRYPEEARRAGQQGLVLLQARVNSAGRADEVRIRTSSGFRLLDEAAQQAVRRWKFQPARFGSVAVDSNVQVPIRFQLDKN